MVFVEYLVSDRASTQQELQMQEFKDIFTMSCEILQVNNDTYVNLHFITLLAAYFKQRTPFNLYGDLMPQVQQLVKKLSEPVAGVNEAASLHLGHLICLLFQHSGCAADGAMPIITNLCQRIMQFKNNTSAGVKSAMLPLCNSLFKSEKDFETLIQGHFNAEQLSEFMAKLLGNFRHSISSMRQRRDAAAIVQAQGLACLLKLTTKNIEFASL